MVKKSPSVWKKQNNPPSGMDKELCREKSVYSSFLNDFSRRDWHFVIYFCKEDLVPDKK